MEEIWKDIKDYENLYQVSNLGNVRSLKYNHTNEIIKIFDNILELRKNIKLKGYGHIYCCCNGKRKSAYGYRWEYADKM